ncbi:MAG: hypothetical protein QXI41_01495 [Candidatus Pacearchaeota archaeon]
MKKKSQATLFILVAVFVVALFFIIFFTPLKERFFPKHFGIFEEYVNNVKTYTDACVKETINKVVLETGKRSGYYEVPELSKQGIAYYFYEEQNLTPNLSLLENELKKGLEKELDECLKNFSSFRKKNLEFNISKPEIRANITQAGILFEVNFSTILKREEKTAVIECCKPQLIQVRLQEIHAWAVAIVDDCLEGESIYLTKFPDMMLSEKLVLNVTLVDRIAIFEITDLNSRIGDENYSFLFAGRF